MQATVWTRLPSGTLRLSKRISLVQQSCAGATVMSRRSMSSTQDADLVVIGSGPGLCLIKNLSDLKAFSRKCTLWKEID